MFVYISGEEGERKCRSVPVPLFQLLLLLLVYTASLLRALPHQLCQYCSLYKAYFFFSNFLAFYSFCSLIYFSFFLFSSTTISISFWEHHLFLLSLSSVPEYLSFSTLRTPHHTESFFYLCFHFPNTKNVLWMEPCSSSTWDSSGADTGGPHCSAAPSQPQASWKWHICAPRMSAAPALLEGTQRGDPVSSHWSLPREALLCMNTERGVLGKLCSHNISTTKPWTRTHVVNWLNWM